MQAVSGAGLSWGPGFRVVITATPFRRASPRGGILGEQL